MKITEDLFKINEIILSKIKFRMQRRVGELAMKSLSVELFTDFIVDGFMHEISINILGQHNVQIYREYYYTPKNWWQHLKMDWFPKWLLEKFPVKFQRNEHKITIDHIALLPEWNKIIPDQNVVMYSKQILND